MMRFIFFVVCFVFVSRSQAGDSEAKVFRRPIGEPFPFEKSLFQRKNYQLELTSVLQGKREQIFPEDEPPNRNSTIPPTTQISPKRLHHWFWIVFIVLAVVAICAGGVALCCCCGLCKNKKEDNSISMSEVTGSNPANLENGRNGYYSSN